MEGKGKRRGKNSTRDRRRRRRRRGGVTEKTLSWDPPAGDFLPLMYSPFFFFFFFQRNLAGLIAYSFPIPNTTFTSNTAAMPLLIATNLTQERGDDEGEIGGRAGSGRKGDRPCRGNAEAIRCECNIMQWCGAEALQMRLCKDVQGKAASPSPHGGPREDA